jgi:hypothetical protein
MLRAAEAERMILIALSDWPIQSLITRTAVNTAQLSFHQSILVGRKIWKTLTAQEKRR